MKAGEKPDAQQKAALKNKGFQPGRSGNPKGRTPVPVEVVEAAKLHTMESIETLLDVMRNGKNDNSRVTASVAMLNRGWGAPKVSVDVDVIHKQDITSLLDALDQWQEQKAVQASSGKIIEAEVLEDKKKPGTEPG